MNTATKRRPLTAEMMRRCAEGAPALTSAQASLIRQLMPPAAAPETRGRAAA